MTEDEKDRQLKLDHDLLVALNTKFDVWMEEFRRISNGVGFPRCAQRESRLMELEKDMTGKAWREEITESEKRLAQQIESLAHSVRWLRNTFFGGSAIFALVGLVWAIVQLITKMGG